MLGLAAFKLFGFPGWGRPVLWSEGQFFSSIAVKPTQMILFALLLGLFGVMGLRLPTVRWARVVYLAIEFVIIGTIAHLQGWGLESVSPLLIIVLLRSSVVFREFGRWTIAALVWLVYPLTLFPFFILWMVLRFSTVHNRHQIAFPGLTILPDGSATLHAGNASANSVTRSLPDGNLSHPRRSLNQHPKT